MLPTAYSRQLFSMKTVLYTHCTVLSSKQQTEAVRDLLVNRVQHLAAKDSFFRWTETHNKWSLMLLCVCCVVRNYLPTSWPHTVNSLSWSYFSVCDVSSSPGRFALWYTSNKRHRTVVQSSRSKYSQKQHWDEEWEKFPVEVKSNHKLVTRDACRTAQCQVWTFLLSLDHQTS